MKGAPCCIPPECEGCTLLYTTRVWWEEKYTLLYSRVWWEERYTLLYASLCYSGRCTPLYIASLCTRVGVPEPLLLPADVQLFP